ncbi:sugar phosphate isomerase/epimerase family protein [Halosimplex halophilum]|uniref:sugar phosphate isomerase/epimerase family protein n=1 Tax=Halosimplex halophilum TaxID=2559572 RepID=UPI00107F748A|nr:sugar phosphate isomerase/epimerase family protein [Halosimplex halophilum]
MSSVGAAMDVRFGATVAEFVAYLDELGLSHLELKREYLHGHPDAPDPETVGEIADEYGVTVTYHAPFRDWNAGSFNDAVREASVDQVKRTIDDAAAADAGAVVVHGGSVPTRYPEWVRETAREHAHRSLAECAQYAQLVGVPLCLENQPVDDQRRRYTTTPEDLESMLDEVAVAPEYLGVTLDVGHAKVNGYHWRKFVDRFGDRIRVCHLSDNDGTADDHEPLPDYRRIVDAVPADYFAFEMKSVGDIARCMGVDPESVDTPLATPSDP